MCSSCQPHGWRGTWRAVTWGGTAAQRGDRSPPKALTLWSSLVLGFNARKTDGGLRTAMHDAISLKENERHAFLAEGRDG